MEQRILWGSIDEEEESEQKKFKFLCHEWDLEIIKDKGFQKPKFTIYLMFACAVISLTATAMTYGVASGFNYLNFLPMFLGLIIFNTVNIYELGIYQSKISLKQIIILSFIKFIASLMGGFSIIYSLIYNLPFNNVVYFILAVFACIYLPFWMACMSNDHVVPKFLKPKTKQQIKSKQTSKSNLPEIKINNNQRNQQQIASYKKPEIKNEWQIYLKRLWTSFVSTVMLIDVSTDIFYGYQLVILQQKSQFFLISGVLLIICCVADWIIMVSMIFFPGWSNHFAHTIAFVSEIPNFVLTGLSIWKMIQLEINTQDSKISQQQLAILSIVTTSLNALLHIMYIVDGWVVKKAVEFLQEQ